MCSVSANTGSGSVCCGLHFKDSSTHLLSYCLVHRKLETDSHTNVYELSSLCLHLSFFFFFLNLVRFLGLHIFEFVGFVILFFREML